MRKITRNDIITVVIVFLLVMLAVLLFTRYAAANDGTPELLTISASVDGLTVTVSGTYANAYGVRIIAQPPFDEYDWQHYTCQSYFSDEFSCSFVLAENGYPGNFYIVEIGIVVRGEYQPVAKYLHDVEDDDAPPFYTLDGAVTGVPVVSFKMDTETPTETPTATYTATPTPTATPTATVGAFIATPTLTPTPKAVHFPIVRG